MEIRFDRITDVARFGSFWLTQFAIQSIDLVKGTTILIFQKKTNRQIGTPTLRFLL